MERNKIQLVKEGHLINVIHPIKKMDKVRFDLVKGKLFKLMKDTGIWTEVKHQYEFFHNYSVDDIETQEERFKKLLEVCKVVNKGCISISTFLTRLPEIIHYENYIREGIEIEYYCNTDYYGSREKKILLQPLSFYSKAMIKFFKDNHMKVTIDLELTIKHQYKEIESVINSLNTLEITSDQKKDFLRLYTNNYGTGRNLRDLIIVYHYDLKALINYLYDYLIPFEDVQPETSITLLYDYYSMCTRIGRAAKKYPKYLKSIHDIIVANYNAFKQQYDEQMFKEVQKPELEYEGEKLCVIVPQCTKDIIQEGTSLNHCVGSYIAKILAKQTYIFFLRNIKTKEDSLVTLELNGQRITQAKGAYNRSLSEDEREFLVKYCKRQKLELAI